MKVFIINSMYKFGSTGRIVYDMATLLAKNNDEVAICYGLGSKVESRFRAFKVSNRLNYYFHNFLAKLLDKTGLFSTSVTKRIIKKIKDFSPDLIQLHNIHGYWLNYRVLFRFFATSDIPIVWTLHDSWPFTGRCAHFDYSRCNEWKTGCKRCNFKGNYPKTWIFDHSAVNYRIKKNSFTSVSNLTIVTPSLWLAQNVRDSFLNKYDVLTINNGIDLDLFTRTESSFRLDNGIGDRKMVLAISNNWDQKKGLYDLIKLSYVLSDDFCLVVVGLNKKQTNLFNHGTICVEKTTNIRELVEIYSAADVFVNLTYEDTFPTVNIESLACGTPVITYRTGGSPEIIDEHCGIVVNQGSIDDVIKSLDSISRFTSQNCRRRAEDFKKTDRYEEYIDLYRQIIERIHKNRG